MVMKFHELAAGVAVSTVSLSVDSSFFSRSFYHQAILPLALVTAILAWCARPSSTEERPAGFFRFQCIYLSVWSLCVAADWLQGPYVYALYDSYGFSSSEIAQLFVAGFGSSLAFGCFVGAFADQLGRKRCALAYCFFYVVSCLTKHYNSYAVLMVGRITGGIATSMLFSCFECWMVSEHTVRRRFSSGLLSYMFGLMFTVMYAVAIVTGILAQVAADSMPLRPITPMSNFHVGGNCTPFDLSIVCLLIGGTMIALLWDENYGDSGMDGDARSSAQEQPSALQRCADAMALLRADRRLPLLGVAVAVFEGSMYSFVFNWTPALKSERVPPPFGIIFSLFMMACMCGASTATILANRVELVKQLCISFAVGALALSLAATVTGGEYLVTCFCAFLAFEFAVGMYFPSIGVLKSNVVPERIRGTMYNFYRVPLNGLVILLLLTKMEMLQVFRCCTVLLVVGALCIVAIGWQTSSIPGAAAMKESSLSRKEGHEGAAKTV